MSQELKLESINFDLAHLEKIFRFLPGVVSWKNTNSIYLGCNDTATKLFGFSSDSQLIGCSDATLRCQASENADMFVEQDQIILEHKKPIDIIDVNIFADGRLSIFHTKKMPILNTQDVPLGVLVQCQQVTDPKILNSLLNLSSTDDNFVNQKSTSYLIDQRHQDDILSEKELECFFYVLRGKSAPQIAQILFRSKRTIETHIENIKTKLNCSSKSDLIDIGIHLGFYSYIPKSFFNQSITLRLE